jgi:hypothetical protein
MTVEMLSMVVGTHAAARLEALKSRLGDTNEERAAENLPEMPALRVMVVGQSTDGPNDFLTLSCGHSTMQPHDTDIWAPDGLPLIGAETTCGRKH